MREIIIITLPLLNKIFMFSDDLSSELWLYDVDLVTGIYPFIYVHLTNLHQDGVKFGTFA